MRNNAYYISSRLVNDRSGKHPDAWRLPAPELEQGIIGRLRAWLTAPGQASRLVRDPLAEEMARIGTCIDSLVAELDGRHAAAVLRALVASVRIARGRMAIEVAAEALAERLQVAPERLDPACLVLEAPFRTRRRGVETRVVLGDQPAEPDRVLIRNLVKARDWFGALTRGESYAEIAAREGTSKQRIQQLLPMAFLAPDIVQMIAEGRQPVCLTTERLITADLPVRWDEQRALVSRL